MEKILLLYILHFNYNGFCYKYISFVKFINSLAKGHPVIITSIIKYLMKNNWNYDNKTFEGLFKGEYFKIINDDTIKKIIETVEESASRELLYRLGLIFGDFWRS